MPFPNPAGYYLPMPEQFETEIEALDISELANVLRDISELLDEVLDGNDFEFQTVYGSEQFDIWVNNLEVDALINLMRWITERLAYLYTKEPHEANA